MASRPRSSNRRAFLVSFHYVEVATRGLVDGQEPAPIVAPGVLDPGGVGRVALDRPRTPQSWRGGWRRRRQRRYDGPTRQRSIALLQSISQATIDEGARGVLAGLAAAGFHEGQTLVVHRYNAQGDAATSSTIARMMIGSDVDLMVTLSTPSLQSVAAANRDAHRPHVFGMVSDPVAAGVGIARDDPSRHPPYMVGIGTMQPVAETFELARRLAPRLARVGVAWNPSEANSEACTKLARTVCKNLGFTLLEANVDQSAAVREAVASLVTRGAEAIWIGGDNTVLGSLDAVIGPARAGGVAVFSSVPGCAAQGALFDLGADYHRVGVSIGQLAARVLSGESPATIPIAYEAPPELWINRPAVEAEHGFWTVPPDIDARIDVLVDRDGPVRRRPRREIARSSPDLKRPAHTWKVGVAAFVESVTMEDAIDGFRRGLKDSGLIEGRDYTVAIRNAQGDIATLSALLDELNGDQTDLVVPFSTVALQAALRKVDRKPAVFGLVLDPFAAGAGKTDADHRPTITGTYLVYPYDSMAETVHAILPRAKKVGTLFSPAEVNSVKARQKCQEHFRRAGLELVSLPINGPTEVSDAALSLCQSGIDVVCQLSDNLSGSTFPAIARACETSNMPLFSFSPSLVSTGAIVGVGADYGDNGHEAGAIAAQVIRGGDPSTIPFRTTSQFRRTLNRENARRFGVSIPAEWAKTAEEMTTERRGTR